MTQQDSARASWGALEAPWRAAIEMAWQSYRDGGIAVGAVLADAAGAVLGEGRNQRFAGRARERAAPRNIVLARAVNSRYQESAHLPGTAAQALEDAWDLLTDS